MQNDSRVQGELDVMPAVDSAMSYSPVTSSIMASMDEDEMSIEAKQCLQALKEGKRCDSDVFRNSTCLAGVMLLKLQASHVLRPCSPYI